MKKKIIIIGLCFLLLLSGVFAYEQLNRMFFDQGETKVNIHPLGIFPDGFSVVFDEPVPNDKYTISLQGFETPIEEVWDANNDALYGYGNIVKTCQVTMQTREGFSGICHWELYLTSMAYGEMGYYETYSEGDTNYHSNRYSSMSHLEQHYRLEGVGENWDLVRWSIAGKEGRGVFIIDGATRTITVGEGWTLIQR